MAMRDHSKISVKKNFIVVCLPYCMESSTFRPRENCWLACTRAYVWPSWLWPSPPIHASLQVFSQPPICLCCVVGWLGFLDNCLRAKPMTHTWASRQPISRKHGQEEMRISWVLKTQQQFILWERYSPWSDMQVIKGKRHPFFKYAAHCIWNLPISSGRPNEGPQADMTEDEMNKRISYKRQR